jgi:hypothetical protein
MKRNKSRVSERQIDAFKRQEARDNRSPREQVVWLDNILGKGKGAKRERARLDKIMEARKGSK